MSGRLALLIIDVLDSTALAERLGESAVARFWEAHDRVSRDLLRLWCGREIDKSDGFLLLFDTASDAIQFALAYHRALQALPVPVVARAGIHVADVTLRSNTASDIALGAKPIEVEGIAKVIAARVMSAAQGGQTLVTEAAGLDLATADFELRALGHWRLKGIEEPLRLFEVGLDHEMIASPVESAKAYRVARRNELWVPLRQVRHSLPAERDAFVGRHAELKALQDCFESGARLVSVLGIGGGGKSRLALRYGWNWLGDFEGGVWFCDLSQARSMDGISFAVAQGLDVPLGSDDPVSQLAAAIAGRGACLVILDNFEQVSRHAEETLGRWLGRAPDARFLVTSREVLGIRGEDVLALPPLTAEQGAALFLKRASAARHDFHPGAEDRAAMGPLVRLLDGLPLAIELAAARVRVMPPHMLLPRMRERFKLLVSSGGRRDRQATLRTAFDWSWDTLPPMERLALAQLSVLENGWALSAAEAVLDVSTIERAPWSLDLVQSLVEKSWIRQVADERFDMLGSVRDYADEHLRTEGRFEGSGPRLLKETQARHWRHFAGKTESEAVSERCVDTENLVAACQRAAAHGDIASATRALVVCWAALRRQGPFKVAVDLAGRLLEVSGLGTGERATVLWVAGCALYMLGKANDARHALEEGVGLARLAEEQDREGWLLSALAEQLTAQGLIEPARDALVRASAIAALSSSRTLQCRVANASGALLHHLSRLDEARIQYEAALELSREIGDLRWQGGLLGNLGGLHHAQGHALEALALYEQALHLAKEAGDRSWEGNTRCNLGLLHFEQDRGEAAQSEFEAALLISREMGHVRLECVVLCNLGIVLERQEDKVGALASYERALEVAIELGDSRSQGQIRGYLGFLYACIGRREDALACLDTGFILLHEVDDRMSLGLLVCSRAKVELLLGNGEGAQQALAQARRLAEESGSTPASELGRELEAITRLIVATPI